MRTVLSGLITSGMRIRILMRLFINPNQHAYLRELADEFSASTSQVREELQRLYKAGLLDCKKQGRQINYHANTEHPLFPELQSMVSKALGMDHILESILDRLGNLKYVYLIDDYAQGKDTGIIDLVLIGNIDIDNLNDLVKKSEKYITRKIRTLVLNSRENAVLGKILAERPNLLLWESGNANKP